MRTHIRMHFDKKTNDFNEENYISCTLDEENTDTPAPASIPTTVSSSSLIPNPVSSPENAQAAAIAQIHHCDKCSYTTSFKANLVCALIIAFRVTEHFAHKTINEKLNVNLNF